MSVCIKCPTLQLHIGKDVLTTIRGIKILYPPKAGKGRSIMANLTKKELFNAKNNGVAISNGLELEVVGVGTFPDTDKDGNAVNVTALKTASGEIYTTISATIFDCVAMLDEIIAEETKAIIVVHEKESKNGRKFLQLEIK